MRRNSGRPSKSYAVPWTKIDLTAISSSYEPVKRCRSYEPVKRCRISRCVKLFNEAKHATERVLVRGRGIGGDGANATAGRAA
jgi:hypothetical protein